MSRAVTNDLLKVSWASPFLTLRTAVEHLHASVTYTKTVVWFPPTTKTIVPMTRLENRHWNRYGDNLDLQNRTQPNPAENNAALL